MLLGDSDDVKIKERQQKLETDFENLETIIANIEQKINLKEGQDGLQESVKKNEIDRLKQVIADTERDHTYMTHQ